MVQRFYLALQHLMQTGRTTVAEPGVTVSRDPLRGGVSFRIGTNDLHARFNDAAETWAARWRNNFDPGPNTVGGMMFWLPRLWNASTPRALHVTAARYRGLSVPTEAGLAGLIAAGIGAAVGLPGDFDLFVRLSLAAYAVLHLGIPHPRSPPCQGQRRLGGGARRGGGSPVGPARRWDGRGGFDPRPGGLCRFPGPARDREHFRGPFPAGSPRSAPQTRRGTIFSKPRGGPGAPASGVRPHGLDARPGRRFPRSTRPGECRTDRRPTPGSIEGPPRQPRPPEPALPPTVPAQDHLTAALLDLAREPLSPEALKPGVVRLRNAFKTTADPTLYETRVVEAWGYEPKPSVFCETASAASRDCPYRICRKFPWSPARLSYSTSIRRTERFSSSRPTGRAATRRREGTVNAPL
ncbi:MAG: hypothetical protein IPI26_02310 [Elusimicrobia bacterium]|nr:hypothetical protein [Elusimicrobiota bacterium]